MKSRFRLAWAIPIGVAVPLILLVALVGCKVGPDYKRPVVDAPGTFRRAASDTNAPDGSTSFGDVGWWNVFKDPQLSAYLKEALTNSWDIKIAASRVMQAEATARITHSQYFPSISAGGDLVTARSSEKGPVAIPPGVNPQRTYGDVVVSMSAYEVDLWGRIRRANEAARANLLATVEAQNVVRQTLVTQGATAYLELLELDLE